MIYLRTNIVLFAVFVSVTAQAKLQVVTSTPDLASITRSIGGDLVEVESICSGDQDPHYIDARPSYMRLLAGADLFIRVGLELEKVWESLLLRGSRNAALQIGNIGHLDASSGVVPLGLPTGPVDRSMGDIHPFGNPHYWLDPYNGRIVASTIAGRLAKLDPGNASEFEKGRNDFVRDLDERMFGKSLVARVGGDALWKEENAGALSEFLVGIGASSELGGWSRKSAVFPQTPVVTFHTSWIYFAKRFHLPVVEQLEPKPGISPSPKHLVTVIKAINSRNVRLIMLEPFYQRRVAEFVSGKTGVPVAVISNSSGGSEGGYLSLIDDVVEEIASQAKRGP